MFLNNIIFEANHIIFEAKMLWI